MAGGGLKIVTQTRKSIGIKVIENDIAVYNQMDLLQGYINAEQFVFFLLKIVLLRTTIVTTTLSTKT